jgi:RimJ/RimL family protein N-acetyltransferase
VSTTLETERLVLRPWAADDVGLLLRLSKDPRVTRYIGAGEVWPAQKALDVSDRAVGHWHEHHFGWRVAVSKLTGEQIGFIALDLTRPDTEGVAPGEYEIGWWLDDAFERLDAPHLTGRVRPENTGSVGVMTKLGMTLAYETKAAAGFTIAVYRLERAPHLHQ